MIGLAPLIANWRPNGGATFLHHATAEPSKSSARISAIFSSKGSWSVLELSPCKHWPISAWLRLALQSGTMTNALGALPMTDGAACTGKR